MFKYLQALYINYLTLEGIRGYNSKAIIKIDIILNITL
jgi:hypothetical protein